MKKEWRGKLIAFYIYPRRGEDDVTEGQEPMDIESWVRLPSADCRGADVESESLVQYASWDQWPGENGAINEKEDGNFRGEVVAFYTHSKGEDG